MKRMLFILLFNSISIKTMGPTNNPHDFTNFTNLLKNHGTYKPDPIDDGHSINHAHHEKTPLLHKKKHCLSWCKCFGKQDNN